MISQIVSVAHQTVLRINNFELALAFTYMQGISVRNNILVTTAQMTSVSISFKLVDCVNILFFSILDPFETMVILSHVMHLYVAASVSIFSISWISATDIGLLSEAVL